MRPGSGIQRRRALGPRQKFIHRPPGRLGARPGRESWRPVVICQNRGVASGDTRALIATAVERLEEEIPALRRLKLVIRLELRSRGDAPIWRVEVPGPK